MVADKGIKISEIAKQALDNNKIYERETYDDLILRLINNQKEVKDGKGRKN